MRRRHDAEHNPAISAHSPYSPLYLRTFLRTENAKFAIYAQFYAHSERSCAPLLFERRRYRYRYVCVARKFNPKTTVLAQRRTRYRLPICVAAK